MLQDEFEHHGVFILSASTPTQISLLESNVQDALLHVEGPHRLWQHSLEQLYYTLRLTGRADYHSILPEDQWETVEKEGEFICYQNVIVWYRVTC